MNKLYSIFSFRCPQCHKGKFFKYHPYDLKHVGEVHECCSHCGLKYEKEIGFFYGAMYVSYALGVALFVTLWVSFNLFFPSASSAFQITTITLASVFFAPYLYALSKIIWINFFVTFDKDAASKTTESKTQA